MKRDSKEMISGKKNGIKTAVLILAVLMTAGAVFTGAAVATQENGILPDWSSRVPNTLFYYENVAGLNGTYSNMKETLTLDGMKVLDTVASHPEGIYLNAKLDLSGEPAQIQLKKLDAEITMYVHDATTKEIIYSCIGDKVPQGATVSFKVNPNIPTLYTESTLYDPNTDIAKGNLVGLKFMGPDGSGESTLLGKEDYGASVAKRWIPKKLNDNLMEGKWTVWAYFVPAASTSVGDHGLFAPYTPKAYLNGQKYEFYVTSSTASMTAESTTAEVGGYVAITINGKQNDEYYLKPNDKYYVVKDGQDYYDKDKKMVTIGESGTTTLYLKAKGSGTFTLQLCDKIDPKIVEDDLELTFTKAKITAVVEKDSYYMGTDVKLTGTNDALDTLYYYIEGTNLSFRKIVDNENNLKHIKSSKEWETTIKGEYIKTLNLDTAAYTIFISNVDETDNVKDNVIASDAVYTAVGVNLVKPEIRITSAPSVVVHGDKLTVKGVADSTNKIQYYIFGTNKFHNGTVDVGKNGAFTIEKTINKADYDAGQYYVVLQHPMYDGNYNIAPIEKDGASVIALKNTGEATKDNYDKILFSLNERQSANAAQALCDAIDSEDIDDICTKFSFIVTAEGTEIDPIPSQVIKGLPLTVSGSTNRVDGDSVIVELLSTMFTAASKYSATSASFITLTATPDENGKWAVTFNTDKLNLDEYTVTVKTGTVTSNPAHVEIIEGQIPIPANPASTETTPQNPTAAPVNPTEQAKSPGFGIAAVLAGLGAAVLLRKRA